MKRHLLVFIFACLPLTLANGGPLSWDRTADALSLRDGEKVIWRIVADSAQGKPYFHPLATPSGVVLSDLRPKDHPWHRGLWWSWKFINGLNYWEEDPMTGKSEGRTELTAFTPQTNPDGSAVLEFSISYHPWNEAPLLKEKRTIRISAPANGGYSMDWTSEFTAVQKVVLDRTPLADEPHGASYGGYAGLSMRLSPAMRGGGFQNPGGVTDISLLHGKPAPSMRYSVGPGKPEITIEDDSHNPRSPTSWFLNRDMPYFGPALLFTKAMTLESGEKLVLRYRIRIADGGAHSN